MELRKESNLNFLGRFPLDIDEARKHNDIILIKKGERLPLIHGHNNHILYSFIASNKFVNIGTIKISINGFSEIESHKGDEGLIVLKGILTVRIVPEDFDEKDVNRPNYNINKNEAFYIPGKTKHQYLNLNDEELEFFFAIGPEL